MELVHSWTDDSLSVGKAISCPLWNSMVYYAGWITLLNLFLAQNNSIHSLIIYLFDVQFNIFFYIHLNP
jgi:hypothetical protein